MWVLLSSGDLIIKDTYGGWDGKEGKDSCSVSPSIFPESNERWDQKCGEEGKLRWVVRILLTVLNDSSFGVRNSVQ